jgi:hypothetical protein
MKKFKKQISKSKYQRVWQDKRSDVLIPHQSAAQQILYKSLSGWLKTYSKYALHAWGSEFTGVLLLDGFIYRADKDPETGVVSYWREAVKPVVAYAVDSDYGLEES